MTSADANAKAATYVTVREIDGQYQACFKAGGRLFDLGQKETRAAAELWSRVLVLALSVVIQQAYADAAEEQAAYLNRVTDVVNAFADARCDNGDWDDR